MRIENDILIPELARLLAEGKEVRFTPSGVSMRPFIEGDKDSVILAPLTREPKRGDIVLAHAVMPDKSTTYVLHRIVRITQSPISKHQTPITRSVLPLSEGAASAEKGSPVTHYYLQGDGNLQGEESCLREDILGYVVAIERPNGRRKCLTNGVLWNLLKPIRKYLLKLYRKCAL